MRLLATNPGVRLAWVSLAVSPLAASVVFTAEKLAPRGVGLYGR